MEEKEVALLNKIYRGNIGGRGMEDRLTAFKMFTRKHTKNHASRKAWAGQNEIRQKWFSNFNW